MPPDRTVSLRRLPGGIVPGWDRVSAPVSAWLDVHARYLFWLGVAVLLAGLPLFQLRLMAGHDAGAYLPRFVEFYEDLKAGIIVPRWAPDLGAGYGEPTFNFNPPLLYYLGSAFHAIGFTFVASEDMAAFTVLAVAGLGMYLLAASVFGPRGGLVSAVAYVYAPFVLLRLYVSHALADYAAFAVLPFAFWGIYGTIAFRSRAHWLAATLAIAALMLTSISVAVIAIPALALCAVCVAFAQRRPDGLLRGAWCMAVALALSAFFWIPALRETGYVHISRRETTLDYHDHFLYIQQLFSGTWGYGLSVRGSGDGLSFALGPVHLLLTAFALLSLRAVWRRSVPAGVLIASLLAATAAAVFMSLEPARFIWDHVDALHPLQFPWRFLSLVAITTAFFCGVPFLLLGESRARAANWLMVAMIAAIFLLNFRHADPSAFEKTTDADYSPTNIATKGLAATAREFEPIDVQQFPAQPAGAALTVLSGQAAVLSSTRAPDVRTFVVRADGDARLQLSTFYFPGWTLLVDGAERPTSHSNPQGLMQFPLAKGTHNVRLEFRDTLLRRWSTRLSLLALLFVPLTLAADYALARRRSRREAAEGGA